MPADAEITPICPAERAGRALQAVVRRMEEENPGGMAAWTGPGGGHLGDMIESLEQEVTRAQAVTPAGAMYQMLLLTCVIGDIEDLLEEWSPAQAHLRRLSRVRYSVLHVLERVAGLSTADLDDGFYATEHADPFVQMKIAV